ncbi:MAG TPA: cytochrome c peroxidase [Kofleriaceae bacterium]
MKWLLFVVLLAACPKSGDKPKPVEPVGRGDAQDRLLPLADAGPITLGPVPALPAVPAGLPKPPDNSSVFPEALALGELLFFDPRLSASGSRSCASCHDPATGFSGNVQLAADGKPNLRRTPTLVNLAWSESLGWDGRYSSFSEHLEVHLKGQLGDSLDAVGARLDAVPLYHAHMLRMNQLVPASAVVDALESYVMTRYEGGSAWDRIERTARTKPGTKSSDPIVAGYQLFVGKGLCATCHPPPLYTDHGFWHVASNPLKDPGKNGDFKTPTLRGAAARTSFFHAGTEKSLEDAVAQYLIPKPTTDHEIDKIQLTPDEVKQVVAFLKALTADRPAPTKPVLP